MEHRERRGGRRADPDPARGNLHRGRRLLGHGRHDPRLRPPRDHHLHGGEGPPDDDRPDRSGNSSVRRRHPGEGHGRAHRRECAGGEQRNGRPHARRPGRPPRNAHTPLRAGRPHRGQLPPRRSRGTHGRHVHRDGRVRRRQLRGQHSDARDCRGRRGRDQHHLGQPALVARALRAGGHRDGDAAERDDPAGARGTIVVTVDGTDAAVVDVASNSDNPVTFDVEVPTDAFDAGPHVFAARYVPIEEPANFLASASNTLEARVLQAPTETDLVLDDVEIYRGGGLRPRAARSRLSPRSQPPRSRRQNGVGGGSSIPTTSPRRLPGTPRPRSRVGGYSLQFGSDLAPGDYLVRAEFGYEPEGGNYASSGSDFIPFTVLEPAPTTTTITAPGVGHVGSGPRHRRRRGERHAASRA